MPTVQQQFTSYKQGITPFKSVSQQLNECRSIICDRRKAKQTAKSKRKIFT